VVQHNLIAMLRAIVVIWFDSLEGQDCKTVFVDATSERLIRKMADQWVKDERATEYTIQSIERIKGSLL